MIYRTLHSYILRELLRVFLMTASALTTLMAFGGTFKPLTKQGIDVRDLMLIVVNMMPAMLAYAIPIAALFAAVLVYWRMSTDNELTACRAGGVSFTAIVLPALVLGLAVASVDLVFVNYVVPRFLQSTERAVRQDMGSLIVNQIGRQEKFQVEGLSLGNSLVVTANSAELEPSDDPDTAVVRLEGMAASTVDKRGRPTYMAVAQVARIWIHNLPKEDAAEVTFEVRNSSAFDPTNGYKKVSMTLNWAQMTGKPYRVSSVLKTKPKFLNLKDLRDLSVDPFRFPDVAKAYDRLKTTADFERIAENAQSAWEKNGHRLRFFHMEEGGRSGDELTLTASRAVLDPQAPPGKALTFLGRQGAGDGGVKVQQVSNGKVVATFTCDQVDLQLESDPLGQSVFARLHMHENLQVQTELTTRQEEARDLGDLTFDPPELLQVPAVQDKWALLAQARQSPRKELRDLGGDVQKQIDTLSQKIDSELHSRGSFSLSCLTLVLLGAALGILLRGQNPLAVFVVGFVPAVVLVLLITAGRQLTEGNARNVTTGISLIWAGNAVLLLLVTGVYLRLVRR
jgi:lipopolysaccharide export LptBFGC system permease protein LptF